MKKQVSLILAALISISLAACGGQSQAGDPEQTSQVSDKKQLESQLESEREAQVQPSRTEPAQVKKANYEGKVVSMVTDKSGINDRSLNQAAWQGMVRLRDELGVSISFIESRDQADYDLNLQMSVDQEDDLTWAIGIGMFDAVTAAAKANPKHLFAIVDGEEPEATKAKAEDKDETEPTDKHEVEPSLEPGADTGQKTESEDRPDNLIQAVFRSEQSSFLVGYIAGMMSEKSKVGLIMGAETGIMQRFKYGFMAGLDLASRERAADLSLTYHNIDSFRDQRAAKTAADDMYAGGADIIFQVAGQAGQGVIAAARQADAWVIGVDLDQFDQAPGHVLTSAIKNMDIALFDLTNRVLAGENLAGTTVYYGLEQGAVDLAPSSSQHIPADIWSRVQELKSEIIAGKITIPISQTEYEQTKPYKKK